jgi:hypothetical protein
MIIFRQEIRYAVLAAGIKNYASYPSTIQELL